MSSNRITDFVGTELPEYAVEISMANREAKDATYNWPEDRKPTYGPQGCATAPTRSRTWASTARWSS